MADHQRGRHASSYQATTEDCSDDDDVSFLDLDNVPVIIVTSTSGDIELMPESPSVRLDHVEDAENAISSSLSEMYVQLDSPQPVADVTGTFNNFTSHLDRISKKMIALGCTEEKIKKLRTQWSQLKAKITGSISRSHLFKTTSFAGFGLAVDHLESLYDLNNMLDDVLTLIERVEEALNEEWRKARSTLERLRLMVLLTVLAWPAPILQSLMMSGRRL